MMTTTERANARITELASYLERNAAGFELEGERTEARRMRKLAADIRTELAAGNVRALVKLCAHRSLTIEERIGEFAVLELLGEDDDPS